MRNKRLDRIEQRVIVADKGDLYTINIDKLSKPAQKEIREKIKKVKRDGKCFTREKLRELLNEPD